MEGTKIGYIRVSDRDKNVERQKIKMRELGIDDRFIFTDKKSGKNFNREEYQAMKRIIRRQDIVYLDALDRLGRNYNLIIQEWKHITREIGADIVVLENEGLFDSRKFKEMGEMGKLMEDQFLSLLAYVAESERLRMLRRKEGIDAAKSSGKVKFGRPGISLETLSREQRKILDEQYQNWVSKEITSVDFAKKLDLKKNTFYKITKEYKEKVVDA